MKYQFGKAQNEFRRPIAAGMEKKELVTAVISLLAAIIAYFVTEPYLGQTNAINACLIIVVVGIASLFPGHHGMPFLEYAARKLRPKTRVYLYRSTEDAEEGGYRGKKNRGKE